jgi:hypothetical protein
MDDAPRRADRVTLPMSVTYRVPGDDHWLQSRVVNMSDSGVLFGPTSLGLGASVEMIISSPVPIGSMTPGLRVCVATVVRTNEVGATGARFDQWRFLIES